MSSQRWIRGALLLLLAISIVPGVSGWTLSSWAQSPSGTELLPGTAVTADYSLHFDSWMTGSTFNNDNSLTMFTDLKDPHWSVTKVEPMDGQPSVVEQVAVRQGAQVRLDGWTLSYSRKRFDVTVRLTGTVPEQASTITVVRLQELDENADPVPGTLIKKEVNVPVPTMEPTTVPEVTLDLTPSEIIVITPEPTVQDTVTVPTTKTLYSPGPEPVLVVGALAGLFCIAAALRRRR
jgi:hypothetical protein